MVRVDRRSWLLRARPNPGASVRLYCFPHAGGGASTFHGWARALEDAEVCAVQYPGRENRIREAPHTSLDALVAELLDAVGPEIVPPYVLFGHSMGAAVAFAFASALQAGGQMPPAAVVVSARRAPCVAPREVRASTLADEELVAWMRYLGSVSEQHLENRELMDLVLPVLRADLTLLDGASLADTPPLSCPLHAVCGDHDGYVDAGDVDAWRRYTTAEFSKTILPGGHFYFRDPRSGFLAHLEDVLARTGRAR